ncbi:hypothetical protein ACQ4PT_042449 [Festuca glaucescens]
MAAPNPGGGDPAGLSFTGGGDPVGFPFPGGGDPASLPFPGGGDPASLPFPGGADPAALPFPGGADPAALSFPSGGEFDSSSGGEFDSSSGGADFTDGTSGYSSYSKTPAPAAQLSLEQRVAAAIAKAVIASPMKSSHRWTSSLGGVDLDDDIWEIRFHFPGQDNLERTLGRSDITVLNLLALVEGHGYGIRDMMYYVREKGKGKKGMEVIDSMSKVDKMLDLYDNDKVLNITVMMHKAEWPVGLNRDEMDGPVELEELVVLSVGTAGVSFYSQKGNNAANLVAIDYTDVLYIGTQQSCNLKKGKEVVTVDDSEDELLDVNGSEDEDFYYDIGQYIPEEIAAEREKAIAAELELIQLLRKQKKQKAESPDNVAILEKLRQQKQQREDPYLHFEGDNDVEEIYEPEDESEEEDNVETDYFEQKVKPSRCGPTCSSHYEVADSQMDFLCPHLMKT